MDMLHPLATAVTKKITKKMPYSGTGIYFHIYTGGTAGVDGILRTSVLLDFLAFYY